MDESTLPQPSERDWLIEFLRDRDVACPLCGYNLRELFSERCPECGRGVRLNVLPAEPLMRIWITTLVFMGASAGMGLFVAGIVISEGWPPPRMILVTISLIYFLLSIPLFIVMVCVRGAFLRMERSSQGLFAMFSAIVLGLALLLFFVGLFA